MIAVQKTFQPYFDYDGNSCFPVAAIDSGGNLNGGLDDSGAVTGQCRSNHLGKANTYSRSKCNNGWCAISYALYFEKDMSCANCTLTSHRHDWEGVVAWVRQGAGTPDYVSVSRHGGYETKRWSDVPAKSGEYTARPSIRTRIDRASRSANPRIPIAQRAPSIRATCMPGASRSASGMDVAPERRMSSRVMTYTAAGVVMVDSGTRDTVEISMLTRSLCSRLKSS